MMRRLALFAALVLFTLLCLLTADRPGSAEAQNDSDLLVVATASNRGEVDPCG